MSAYSQAYAERWPTVAELERELGLLPPRRSYGRKKREPLPLLTEPQPCHHCNHPNGCKGRCEWGRKW